MKTLALNKTVFVLSALSVLCSFDSFAFSSRRSLSTASHETQNTVWTTSSLQIESLIKNFESIRIQNLITWGRNVRAEVEKNIQDARLNEVRCKDDWITNKDVARQRLSWAISCSDDRRKRIEANATEANRYSFEETGINAQILLLLGRELQKANDGAPFRYPTLGSIDRASFNIIRGSGLANPDMSSCKVFEDRPNITVAGMCNPGCLAPEQLILFDRGYVPAGDVHRVYTANVVTMDPASELSSPKFKVNVIDQVVRTKDDPRTVIIEIATTGGYRLRVSEEHPVLVKTGVMRRADKIRVGDELIALNGQDDMGQSKLKTVKVTGVVPREYHGSFTNIDIIGQDPKENIIVVNGLLLGSNLYQTERGRDLLEKQLFQALLPTDAVAPDAGVK